MTPVPEELRDTLQDMLDELEGNRLDVVKLRVGKDGCYLRVVLSENAEWYKAFCAANQTHGRGTKSGKWHNVRRGGFLVPEKARNWSHRKYTKPNDTIIKRQNIIRALRNMLAKGVSFSLYAEDLFQVARDLEEEWKQQYEAEKARYESSSAMECEYEEAPF